MTKRYYVSKILGDGSEENPYRPAVADHGVNWSGSIATDENEASPNYGKPLFADCLVIVATSNHAKLRNDPNISALPDFALDGKVSSINTVTKNAMIAALKKRGFSTSDVANTDGFRELLQSIGRQRDPKFNVDNFDVAE
jgi:hypothetical protein